MVNASILRRIRRRVLGGQPKRRRFPADTPDVAADGRMTRHEFLRGIHERLEPRTYLEIGVNDGRSLALSHVPSIAVDPAFKVTVPIRCDVDLVKATSDDFFALPNPLAHFARATADAPDPDPVADLAFIDGMHLFEYALRDFMNTERHARWWSVVVLDDMLPRSSIEASRTRVTGAWTGDVYKVLQVLRAERPDLVVLPVDTAPTGTVVVLGADPSNDDLRQRYDAILARWVTEDPQQVPAEILARDGALDPAAFLASDLWADLARARAGTVSRPEGLMTIRERLATLVAG